MAEKKDPALGVILPRFKDTDMSLVIRMSALVLPRFFDEFLKKLNEKQKSAIDKVMPVGGEKKIYIHLMDTPTPPVVVELAQPPKISTMPEKEVKQQRIKGIRLTINDALLLARGRKLGNMLKFSWRLKGQMFTMLGILWIFFPFLRLGPSGLKDMGNKLASQSKPLLDLVAR